MTAFPLLQYVTNVRTVQKRLQEVEDSIVFINKEEALYKWDQTVYPEVDVIKDNIEPYQRFFGLVLKWQRTEKRFVGLLVVLDVPQVLSQKCLVLTSFSFYDFL